MIDFKENPFIIDVDEWKEIEYTIYFFEEIKNWIVENIKVSNENKEEIIIKFTIDCKFLAEKLSEISEENSL